MKLEKVGSLLKKFDVDIDSIKDDFEAAMEEEVSEIKKEVGLSIKDKILYYIDDEKDRNFYIMALSIWF